ncbi:MAG TPA: hypothetical protein VJ553_00620 [Candidatus Paceibacterota bacterium]|nr:hypothetical protein [Candidatus Paceibacterota bacterium]
MVMKTENDSPRVLTTEREPKGPVRAGAPGSVGDQALKDALILVGAAWAILAFLYFTLKNNNG